MDSSLYAERSSLNSKSRIAKNTFLLYCRTLILMLITLYSSRVVLKTLGVDDYGVYNAICGVVGLISMATGPLSGAVSRYLTVAIGEGDTDKLKTVFSTSFCILFAFSIVSLMVLDPIGVWFLNNKMVIPEGREIAAKWILQLSFCSFVLSMLSAVFSAEIIAHEDMGTYAGIGIFEAILKFTVALLIASSPIDKLIFYSALLVIVQLLVFFVDVLYCRKFYSESAGYVFNIDRSVFKGIFKFTGWCMFGGVASTVHIQGTNILFNLFGGPIANAAQALSNQINSAVNSLVSNFSTALNPSIIKSYAIGDRVYMGELVLQGARFSYFLTLVIAIPILCETDTLLHIWLGEYPPQTAVFSRLIICYSLVRSLSNTLITSLNATGNIKKYQIIVGTLLIANLPISYLALKMGAKIEMVFAISITLEIMALLSRLLLAENMIGISFWDFIRQVVLRIILVSLLSIIIPAAICIFMPPSLFRLLIVVVIGVISTGFVIIYVGCSQSERSLLFSYFNLKKRKQ